MSIAITGSRGEMAKTFGRVLRAQRRAQGISQEELARRGKFDRTYPSLLERGHRIPTITLLFQIAAGLGVSPAVLARKVQEEFNGSFTRHVNTLAEINDLRKKAARGSARKTAIKTQIRGRPSPGGLVRAHRRLKRSR
jgi:transcriptional regulator with XRE-family HTH domain